IELSRIGVLHSARDSDFKLLEIVSHADNRHRLDRLRSGAQEGHEARIAGDRDDRATPKGDGVDAVDGLDDPAATHGYADRVDGQNPSLLAAGRPLAPCGLLEALVRSDREPVRLAGLAAR